MIKQIASFSFCIVFLYGCNKGIEPLPEDMQTGFGGKITFIGEWPDSVTRTHLVVFKDPLNSISDFSLQNIRFVSSEIPFGINEFFYSSKDSSVLPGTGLFQSEDYAYVAVAQSSKQDVSLNREDWFVVGLYYNIGDTTMPGALNVPENTFVSDVNIVCDFNNPPPQPPGGN
jgi:hypothetical protein